MESATTPLTIFWSWQSDTPHSCGKDFVREVLLDVAKLLNQAGLDSREEAEESPVAVDHDTLNVGGSPHIAETVFDKITKAAVFVADITPVGSTGSGKPLPNPNVMLELGWALHCLGKERIVLLLNENEHPFSERSLPFDLRHWRNPVRYNLQECFSVQHGRAVSRELMCQLKDRISPSLATAIQHNEINLSKSKPKLGLSFCKAYKSPEFSEKEEPVTELPLHIFTPTINAVTPEMEEKKTPPLNANLASNNPPAKPGAFMV